MAKPGHNERNAQRTWIKNSFDWPRFFFWARIALFATREQQFTMNAVSVRILSSWALEINAQDPHRCSERPIKAGQWSY